ncbi:MAG TPA: alpha/beta hydrolase [Tissierellales bacterium]|nr:alpha/beta hydrolase [Tissierellales bacterium]
MIIDFNYESKKIEYVSGYIFKGKNYRCSYIRYDSPYRNPAPGTERINLYNFQPKGKCRASTLVLHGLGSRNIKFLLWIGPQLASVGVNTTILIFPGNYTRVEKGSVSGRSFLYPDLDIMYQFWEHAVVDTLSTIDFLEQNNLWKDNNVIMGYCLGGMITTIAAAIDNRMNHKLFITTGGHFPRILHESPTTAFARRLFDNGHRTNCFIENKNKLYNIYEEQFPKIKKMSLSQIMEDTDIHPLFKIDPISYAHLLNMSEVTFIDAFFDSTLPLDSRKYLYNEMEGAKRRILPISHVNWLPFQYILAKYILHKLNIYDRKAKKALLHTERLENPLDETFTDK